MFKQMQFFKKDKIRFYTRMHENVMSAVKLYSCAMHVNHLMATSTHISYDHVNQIDADTDNFQIDAVTDNLHVSSTSAWQSS